MRSASVGLVAAVALIAWPVPGVQAATTGSATIDTHAQGGISWVEAVIGPGEHESADVRILAPRRDGNGRFLWQTCRFVDVVVGAVYRCGIDVSPGSLARRHPGTWAVRITVDGVLVGTGRMVV